MQLYAKIFKETSCSLSLRLPPSPTWHNIHSRQFNVWSNLLITEPM